MEMTREEAIRIIKIVLAIAEDFEITVQGEKFTEEKCKEAVDMAIEALEQEPCEMTAEEYRQRMIQAFHNADADGLIAVCVLPTEKEFKHLEWLLKNHYKKASCDDAVSRQVVKEQMIKYGFHAPDMTVTEFVKDLPLVNPQLKMGRWVKNDRGIPICSCCREYKYKDIDGSIYDDTWFPNYCPNCGVKMVESQERSEE